MIALYIDEDALDSGLVGALRHSGYDVLTAEEAGMRGRSDREHLALATAEGRILFSYDKKDYFPPPHGTAEGRRSPRGRHSPRETAARHRSAAASDPISRERSRSGRHEGLDGVRVASRNFSPSFVVM